MRQKECRPRSALDQGARKVGQDGSNGQITYTKLIVARCGKLVDSAAILAGDVATLAARTGRGDHARAATHLTAAAHHAWRAAEALSESEVAR